jgi:hypothetical protein
VANLIPLSSHSSLGGSQQFENHTTADKALLGQMITQPFVVLGLQNLHNLGDFCHIALKSTASETSPFVNQAGNTDAISRCILPSGQHSKTEVSAVLSYTERSNLSKRSTDGLDSTTASLSGLGMLPG